jgi:RNA polymerase sigma-70 factor (ECF subfamily)
MARDPLARPEPLIRSVYAYVAYRIGPGAEAEDVTSDTFERALRGRDTYDASQGPPIAWLIGIARRCVADAMRTRPAPLADPADVTAPGPEEASVRRLTLGAAIATLDERDQELLALRYGGDLTARRIGEILELRPNTVEVALHRAVSRLRELLDETPADATTRKGLTASGRIPGDRSTNEPGEGRHEAVETGS